MVRYQVREEKEREEIEREEIEREEFFSKLKHEEELSPSLNKVASTRAILQKARVQHNFYMLMY